MKIRGSRKKKYLILGTIGSGVLAVSIVTPVVILNNKNDKVKEDEDINKIVEILKNKSFKEKIIELASNTNGKIVANNQEKIIEKIKTLIGQVNLKGVKIEILMQKDTNISIVAQKIIIKLTKNEVSKEVKDFLVKKKNIIDEEIASIKKVLDAKTGEDLVITLPSNSTGNIISKATNKNEIEKKLRILVDPSNTNGEDNHASLKGTTIEVSMKLDAPISTTPQNIILSISKTDGTTVTTTKTFSVKRDFTTSELANKDIAFIKNVLDAKIGDDLIITLPNNSTGNIIRRGVNKNAIEKQLRKLIDPSNTNGEYNHASLKGTTIEVSMKPDAPISTTPQNIIVSISKTDGTTVTTTKTFSVKRDFTTIELADKDISFIKNILDAKTGEDLIIILPNNSTGKIIENAINKNAIEKQLRKLIDPSNNDGQTNHPSLKGTVISISMSVDAPISTTLQNIIVSISKTGGTTLTTTKTFLVKRDFTNIELTDKDIASIKKVLDAKTGEDLIITLPNDSTGNIIGEVANKNAIEKQLRILVDPSNTNGEDNHESLKGTTIEVSMKPDAPISTTAQNIIVSIIKTDGTTLETRSIFQVKRDFTNSELANKDIASIKNILDAKTGDDLIITLPGDSNGNIIEKTVNKNAIEKELRKLIDPLNIDGDVDHPSLKGTSIEVSMNVDAPISTTPQDVIVSIIKTDGTTLITTKIFQVKREFSTTELANKDIAFIKNVLDNKTGEDLIITLPSDSSGNIIGKVANKNAIEKQLRKLIDPLNDDGDANHQSLRGTSIEVSMNADVPISTTPQDVIVSIIKNDGTTLETAKIFQVKRELNIKEINEDILAIKNILDSKTEDDLIITLPSDSSGNIIGENANKDAIIKELRKLIDSSNKDGQIDHPSLRGVTIEVSMDVDAPISTTLQNIIVSISKIGGTTLRTINIFQVKRDFTVDEDISAIRRIFDTKTGDDLKITLPSSSNGNIIGKTANKNAIEKELRKLIDPSNIDGQTNHPSLRGTNIIIYMDVDAPISTTLQSIIVTIRKANRSFILTKTFQVKREFSTTELANKDIEFIKNVLDTKTGDDLTIILPSSSSGNIIGEATNKNAIIKELRKLIDPSNIDGQANHPSLKGTTIEVSMDVDALISATLQNIIVSISKIGGTTITTTKTFQVKRDFTANEDIIAIRDIFDNKIGEDLIITLPSDSSGNIIGEATNKNAIIKELRKLIDFSNIDGQANHPSLREVTIEVSMDVDAPISTTLQNIIVSISKTGGTTLTITKIFQVNRYTRTNEDIVVIKNILDAKTEDDLIITLPSDSSGNIISEATNKNAVIKELRKLIDSSNIDGQANHPSLRGVTIEVSMNVDAPISTTLQNIIVSISKTGGTTLTTTKTFQVKRAFTIDEDIVAIKNILDSKTEDDLIITLPSDSGGNIISEATNKNAVIKELRKLIDFSNIDGQANHPSLREVTIEVSMNVDAPISTTLQNIIVSISKTGGTTLRTTSIFNVKRAFTNSEKITNYFSENAKKTFTIFGGEALNTKAKILTAIKKHLAEDDPNLWTNTIQSLISVDDDETINQIVKENYDETSFSIVYNDGGMTQSVELKIKHLRTKTENRIIVNNLYAYYNSKWNTRKKALVVTLKNVNRWTGPQVKKAVNDATKNIYIENKVKFGLNGYFYRDDYTWAENVTNNPRDSWNFSLNTPRKFRVVFHSGKNKKIFRKNMNIFIRAIRG